MGLLDAIIADVVDSRGNKKQEWAYHAKYLSGHPDFIGSKSVVLWVNEDGLGIHKQALVYGKGVMLFTIPYSKVVNVEGDGTSYTSDNNFTARRLTVTVSGVDANGDRYDVPIAFDIGLPWKSIPKIIGLVNRHKGVKI